MYVVWRPRPVYTLLHERLHNFQLRIHGLVLEPVLTPGADNAPVVELIEEHVVVPHITSELNDLF